MNFVTEPLDKRVRDQESREKRGLGGGAWELVQQCWHQDQEERQGMTYGGKNIETLLAIATRAFWPLGVAHWHCVRARATPVMTGNI